jgi:hypothetical protein
MIKNDGSEAYKKWFEANREKLNERRRNRYKQDKAYREKVKQQSKNTKLKAKQNTINILELENGTSYHYSRIGEALEQLNMTVNQFNRIVRVLDLDVWSLGNYRVLTDNQISVIDKVRDVKKNSLETMKALADSEWLNGTIN